MGDAEHGSRKLLANARTAAKHWPDEDTPMSYEFELGPIRPPSESESLLLRITRNCPWNKCAFCSTYKEQSFSRRSVDEVRRDIDSMRAIATRILDASGGLGGKRFIGSGVIAEARGLDDTPEYYYKQVGFWLHFGIRSAFLQDANSLILPGAELSQILLHLRESFPSIERITSYARSKTLAKKPAEELHLIRQAGLSRIHIGMETGCDEVLELVNKGVSSAEHIAAGRRVIEAGFDLSEYYMPGLGGMERWRENAIESARVVNAINPTFIRLRSTIPLPGTPLYDLFERKKWTPLSEDGKVREIRLFIERLEGITGTIASDHIMNLLEDVEGSLPEGKKGMLDAIDRYLALSDDERESFIIARRLGYARNLSDYRSDDRIEAVKRELKQQFASIDEAVLEIAKNYL